MSTTKDSFEISQPTLLKDSRFELSPRPKRIFSNTSSFRTNTFSSSELPRNVTSPPIVRPSPTYPARRAVSPPPSLPSRNSSLNLTPRESLNKIPVFRSSSETNQKRRVTEQKKRSNSFEISEPNSFRQTNIIGSLPKRTLKALLACRKFLEEHLETVRLEAESSAILGKRIFSSQLASKLEEKLQELDVAIEHMKAVEGLSHVDTEQYSFAPSTTKVTRLQPPLEHETKNNKTPGKKEKPLPKPPPRSKRGSFGALQMKRHPKRSLPLPPAPSFKPEHADPSSKFANWQECYTPEGHRYFYNTETQESTWDDPLVVENESDDLWVEAFTEEGDLYYYNCQSGETSWMNPTFSISYEQENSGSIKTLWL